MPSVRRAVRLLAGATALGLLAGCGGMPTSGPIEAGEDIGAQPARAPISVVANPPQVGDDEDGIVEDFVLAGGSYEPGFAVARSYLAPDVADQWDPGAQIQVFDAGRGYALTRTAPGEVTLTLPLVGTVSTQGTFEAAPAGTVLTQVVGLTQVDGEWRISRPPDGLLLSAFDYAREYSPFDVYFPDPSGSVLVPDRVVLPLGGSRATLLVQAVLDGPSSWIAPAVRTAFPDGTSLALRAVEVEGGVARVSLSDEARRVEGLERTRLAAQLAVTLQQVPEVDAVRIEAGGTPLVVPGAVDGVVAFASVRSYDPATTPRGATVYGVRDGAVVSLLEDRTEPVGGPLGEAVVPAQSVAVALDSSRAAVVDEAGSSLAVSGFLDTDTVTAVVTGTNLSAPTWDRNGLVWVADRTDTGSRLLVSDGTSTAEAVGGAGLDGVRVESIRMAPDGVRLLMVVSTGGRSEVRVGLVRRPEDGEPTQGVELLSTRTVPLPLTVVLDAVWSGTQEVSLLGGSPDADVQPYEVDLGGSGLSGQGAAPGADSLADAPRNSLVLGTSDGRLLVQDALGVRTPAGEGRRPTYPG